MRLLASLLRVLATLLTYHLSLQSAALLVGEGDGHRRIHEWAPTDTLAVLSIIVCLFFPSIMLSNNSLLAGQLLAYVGPGVVAHC